MTTVSRLIRAPVVGTLAPALTQQNVQSVLTGMGTSGAHYLHQQLIPVTMWLITHNLNKYPSVTVMDNAGSKYMTDVRYIDTNTVEIRMTYPMSGTAALN